MTTPEQNQSLPDFFIIGHRGAQHEAPENTEEGFAHLRQAGIHQVEVDVRLTQDKELVIFHDETVDRTTHANGPLNAFTLEQLQGMDASRDFPHPWNQGATIPCLDSLLAPWPSLAHMQLEVKPAPAKDHPVLGSGIAHAVAKYQLESVVFVTSSDIDFLQWMQAHHPNIQRGYVAYDTNGSEWTTIETLECTLLCSDWTMIDKGYVQTAQAMNIPISAWTVNDIDTAQTLKGWGVQSIITDIPTKMATTL